LRNRSANEMTLCGADSSLHSRERDRLSAEPREEGGGHTLVLKGSEALVVGGSKLIEVHPTDAHFSKPRPNHMAAPRGSRHM